MDTGVGVRVPNGREPSEGVWLREPVQPIPESAKDVFRACAYEKVLAAGLGFRDSSDVLHTQPDSSPSEQ